MTRTELALKAELEVSLTEDSRAEHRSLSARDIKLGLAGSETDEMRQRELVLGTLTLPDRGLAQPALARFVTRATWNSSNGAECAVTLAELYAATVLALLDDRSGLPILRSVGTLTNSQIEYFYARAALTLLHENIPASLVGRRSVFRQREGLIDAAIRLELMSPEDAKDDG